MSDMTFKDNPDYWVGILSSGNVHCAKVLKKVRGFKTLKKGMFFDFDMDKYECEGQGRIYQATTNYYVDDPEDEIGCIDVNELYNPEI